MCKIFNSAHDHEEMLSSKGHFPVTEEGHCGLLSAENTDSVRALRLHSHAKGEYCWENA